MLRRESFAILRCDPMRWMHWICAVYAMYASDGDRTWPTAKVRFTLTELDEAHSIPSSFPFVFLFFFSSSSSGLFSLNGWRAIINPSAPPIPSHQVERLRPSDRDRPTRVARFGDAIQGMRWDLCLFFSSCACRACLSAPARCRAHNNTTKGSKRMRDPIRID